MTRHKQIYDITDITDSSPLTISYINAFSLNGLPQNVDPFWNDDQHLTRNQAPLRRGAPSEAAEGKNLQRKILRFHDFQPSQGSKGFEMHVLFFFWGWLLYCYTSPGDEKLLVKTSLFLWWFKRFKRPGFRKWCKRRCNTSSLSGDLCFFFCDPVHWWFLFGVLLMEDVSEKSQLGFPKPHFFELSLHLILFDIWGEEKHISVWCPHFVACFVDFVCLAVKMPSNSWDAKKKHSGETSALTNSMESKNCSKIVGL